MGKWMMGMVVRLFLVVVAAAKKKGPGIRDQGSGRLMPDARCLMPFLMPFPLPSARRLALFLLPAACSLMPSCASDPTPDFKVTESAVVDSSPRNVTVMRPDGTMTQALNHAGEGVELQMDFMKLLGSGVQSKIAWRAAGVIGASSAGFKIIGGELTFSETPVMVRANLEEEEEGEGDGLTPAVDVYPVLKKFTFESLEIDPAAGNAGVAEYAKGLAPYYMHATTEQRIAYEANVKAWMEFGVGAVEAMSNAFPILLGMPPVPAPVASVVPAE